jgi:hypothetical protein
LEKTFQNILVQFQLIPDLPGRENRGRQDASRNGLGLESPATCGGIRFHGLPRDGGSYSGEDGLMLEWADPVDFLAVLAVGEFEIVM